MSESPNHYRCPGCGNTLTRNDETCKFCGYARDPITLERERPVVPMGPKPKGMMLRYTVLALGIIAACIAIMAFFSR